MTIKQNDQNPHFELAASTGGKMKRVGLTTTPGVNKGASEDADDWVHQQEESRSSQQIMHEDPDELVHRMNTFKPGPSLTTDMDDEIHQKYQEEDMDDR